jgi:hypothetical protein
MYKTKFDISLEVLVDHIIGITRLTSYESLGKAAINLEQYRQANRLSLEPHEHKLIQRISLFLTDEQIQRDKL